MTEYTDNFERFWQAYPKRNGRKVGKRPANNQWIKLTADERRAAFADVEKRNRQQGWGKYIRDAQRYLRDHGWEDEWSPPQQELLARPPEPELPRETDPYVASVKRIAARWLIRRGLRGRSLPDERVPVLCNLVRSLADDARAMHQRGELTDAYAQTIRDELDEFAAR